MLVVCMQTSSVSTVGESAPAGLEEELLEAKRLLAEERGRCEKLAQHLASVEGERVEQEQKEEGRWQVLKGEIRLLKLRMEQAIKERTDEVSVTCLACTVCVCSVCACAGVEHSVGESLVTRAGMLPRTYVCTYIFRFFYLSITMSVHLSVAS